MADDPLGPDELSDSILAKLSAAGTPERPVRPDEALAVAYIASGAHGVSMDLKLTDEEIRKVVTQAIKVWREIQRQLKE